MYNKYNFDKQLNQKFSSDQVELLVCELHKCVESRDHQFREKFRSKTSIT